MKDNIVNRILTVIVPLLVYYLVYNLSGAILMSALGTKHGALLPLMLAGIFTLFVIYTMFRQLPVGTTPIFSFERETIKRDLLFVALGLIIAVILNFILTQSGIARFSEGYEHATSTLNDGSLALKIACNVIIIPLLEEILFRGIIAGQIRLFMSSAAVACVISALAFGASHHNLVQFLYAFLCGLMLAYFYLKTNRLWVSIAIHSLANLVTVLFLT